MIQISEHISLREISLEDHIDLYNLMKRIYTPAYHNYWNDEGEWYVNHLYNVENIQNELEEKDSLYFFVLFENRTIGIFRIVYHVDPHNKVNRDYVKLHRLYLDQSIQNKGIGRQLMNWLMHKVKDEGYSKLWLDAMEQQPQALHFYKKLGFIETGKVSLDFPLLIDEYRGMFKMEVELN